MSASGTAVLANVLSLLSLAAVERLLTFGLGALGGLLLTFVALGFSRGYLSFRSRRERRLELAREEDIASVAELSSALARVGDSDQVTRVFLDGLNTVLGLDFAGLMLVDEEHHGARGLLARKGGSDVDWFPSAGIDLANEPSGVGRAIETRAPFVVENAPASAEVSPRLTALSELTSVVYLPISDERGIVGVVVTGSGERRVFDKHDLALMEAIAAEGAQALGRTRSAAALGRTLERERLVAGISRLARSELDVNRLIEVALAETAKALGVSSCFLRLVEPGGAIPVRTAWLAEGVDPVPADHAAVLSIVAMEERRTIAVDDIAADEELEKAVPGGRDILLGIGTCAGLAAPIIFFETFIGVLVAHAAEPRRWTADDISFVEAIGREFGVALHTARALERERLVAEISRRARSELDVDRLIEVALVETASALGVSRCFIRLGEQGSPAPLRAQWRAEGLDPVPADATPFLSVSNLALRERRTVAVADVARDPELSDESLGGRETLLSLGARAVLATPIILFDSVIGVLAVHSAESRRWSEDDIVFVEAIGREFGIALHTARLLTENRRRLAQQESLLATAEALVSELEIDSVLARLVDQAAGLVAADAADCWIFEHGLLRCRAVVGLPVAEVGRELHPSGAQLAAIEKGHSIRERDLPGGMSHLSDDHRSFVDAIVVPISSEGEIRGVLGVYSRTPERFADVDSEFADSFAEIASIALRNAEVFAQRSRRAHIERGFFRIAALLGESLSLEQTLAAVGEAAGEALGGSFAALLMPENRSLHLAGSHGLPDDDDLAGLLGRADEELLRLASSERRLIVSNELADDERFSETWRATTSGLARSLIVIPVEKLRGSETGLVLVFFTERRSFDDEDLELARQLARAASGALERSELYETERRTRTLAEKLAGARGALASALDPSSVAEQAASQAIDLCNADAAAVMTLDRGELVVRACAGEGLESFVGRRLQPAASIAGNVVHLRRPLAIDNADAGADQAQRFDPMLQAGYSAFLGVSLAGRDNVSGGVLAVYARSPRSWREEEVDALTALAGNTSAAMDNASLYLRVSLERERSLAILESVADGIVVVDRAEKVLLWNTAAERITGIEATDALGRTPAEVLRRDLASGDGEVADRSISILRGDREIWLSLAEAVMRDSEGRITGRIYTLRDVSSDRLIEQAKSDFVTSVSHGLRAPLASIYGFAETLYHRDELFDEEQRRTFLGYITSESERLTEIVGALLDAAQLDAGELEVQIASTDVRPVVQEAVESVSSRAGENAHQFVVDLPDEPLSAEADREKLRRVLTNLVDNAVKYSPGGGTVTVSGCQRAGVVELRVVDEGVGISAAEQGRIFRKFFRGGSSGLVGGSGLGLFITHGLVTAMGGRIWVDSEEGRGSSFVFELPSARGPESGE